MSELPRISGREAVKTFQKPGFFEVRQKGSHVVMRKDEKGCVIFLHKSLATSTLRNAIR